MATFNTLTIDHIIAGVDRANQDRRVRTVVDLATITLLVEAGHTTFEKAAQRIEEVQASLPEPYQASDVTRDTGAIVGWLRAQPPHWRLSAQKEELDPAPGDDTPEW